jgi:O-antigen/teichoic acid export membrane protein
MYKRWFFSMQSAPSLRKRTIKAAVWSGTGQYVSQGIHYVVLLVLAGLLPPSDFGLLGLAMIFVTFAQGVGELGLAAAIIQKLDANEPTLSTAFWANLSVSIALAILSLVMAKPITTFFGNSNASSVIRALSLVFPLAALSVVPQALLHKQLNFRLVSLQQCLSEVGFGFAGVSLALGGFGVWSLVGAVLSQRLIGTLTFWFLVDWRPRLHFDRAAWRDLMHFGGPFLAGALVHRGCANIDYFVVGHWLGTTALGYYTLAFQLAIVPQERLVGMLRRVAFPALSLLQNDPERLRRAFLKCCSSLFSGMLPLSLLIAFAGPWFVKAAYGDKWIPIIQPLQILATAGIFYTFDTAQALYFAVGKPGIRFQLMAARLVFFACAAAAYGIGHGINGIAVSLLLSLILTSIASFWPIVKLLNITPGEILGVLWPSARAACLAMLPALAVHWFRSDTTSPWWISAWLSIGILSFYIISLFPTYREFIKSHLSSKLR